MKNPLCGVGELVVVCCGNAFFGVVGCEKCAGTVKSAGSTKAQVAVAYMLVAAEDVARIYFVLYIVEHAVIAVGNDGL